MAPVWPRKPRQISHWDYQVTGGRNGDGGSLSPSWVPPAEFFKLEAKYDGRDVSGAQGLQVLEDENRKLRRPLACATSDNIVLKDMLGMPDNTEGAAEGSAQRHVESRYLATEGPPSDPGRSEDGAARAPATRQPGDPPGHSGDRDCAQPVRPPTG